MDLSLTYSIPISEQTGRKNKIKGDNYTSIILIIGTTGGICKGSGGGHQTYIPIQTQRQVYGLAKSKKNAK